MHDVIIIGGGPAGLSAALVLARCRRDVALFDSGSPRNRRARAVHNYLTRDGISPEQFLHLARVDLVEYGVSFVTATVDKAEQDSSGTFFIDYRLNDAPSALLARAHARKLILATGVRDVLPDVPGFSDYYGASIHHCPYCDGWEHRDQRLVAFGRGDHAVGLGLSLLTWSSHVTVCTHGQPASDKMLARAAANSLAIRDEPVAAFEGDGTHLNQVAFTQGPPLPCDAVFFNTDQVVRADHLARSLGCSFKENGGIASTKKQGSGVRGLYVAGDVDKDVQFVIVAAAEGASAAIAVNRELQEEDRARPSSSPKPCV